MDLDHLEKVVSNLPKINDFIVNVRGNIFELTTGTTNFCLLNTQDVAVVNAFLGQGDYAPTHGHDAKSWIIVYRGKLKVSTEDGTKVYLPGDYVFIDIGREHSVLAIEDSWVIAITVPADPGFPKT